MICQFPLFYKVFYKVIFVNKPDKRNQLSLELLFALNAFIMFIRLSRFWGVKEASLHHLIVEFKAFSCLFMLRGLGLRVYGLGMRNPILNFKNIIELNTGLDPRFKIQGFTEKCT